MRTTVNLEPEAYRLARAISMQRKTSVGKVLSEALLSQFRSEPTPNKSFIIDSEGFPVLRIGKLITPEDVSNALDEE